MIMNTYIPTYPLNQFVDHFFYYTGFNPKHSVTRFIPDGEVQIIFDLTNYPKPIYDNDTLEQIQSCKKVWFSGFRTQAITIPSGGESEMLIVQFKKGKAFTFLKEPMHQLTNYVVDGELVLGPEILDIRELLLEFPRPLQKFHVLERELLAGYRNQFKQNQFVEFAISKILSSQSQSCIKDIIKKTGYSQKHIIKLFKEQVGVTPKTFHKVIRFQNTIQQIEQEHPIDWSSVVYDCGFYDQSHFIADFKYFSGFTPTAYIEKRGEFLNYLPIK